MFYTSNILYIFAEQHCTTHKNDSCQTKMYVSCTKIFLFCMHLIFCALAYLIFCVLYVCIFLWTYVFNIFVHFTYVYFCAATCTKDKVQCFHPNILHYSSKQVLHAPCTRFRVSFKYTEQEYTPCFTIQNRYYIVYFPCRNI